MAALTQLSIGSNLGNRSKNLEAALRHIKEKCGEITQLSKVYETPALGFESKDNFLNMCVSLKTEHEPIVLMRTLKLIEIEMGRVLKSSDGIYRSRIIDIDIIFYGNEIIETNELVVPHARYKERLFVLIPLSDMVPEFIDPKIHKSIKEIKKECEDVSIIRRYKQSVLVDE